jgi:alkylation response protein AidB-like acyl-CoA dehydrogenase
MNYDLDTEQKLLKEGARYFLSKESNTTLVREMLKDEKGYSPGIWKKMADLGWMGILIPEEYGGHSEMSFIDLTVLLYEMGYACFPSPFFSTAVLGVVTLLEAGSDAQKQNLFPEVASGERILTLAWNESNGTYSAQEILTRADLQTDHYVLSGEKLFVPDAHVADTILCAARTKDFQEGSEEGVSLFIVDRKSPKLGVKVLSSIAGEKLCEITFNQVKVPKQNLLGELNQGWSVLRKVLLKSAVAKCAEMSGGAQKVLEMVIDHAKKRVQFGRPIGSFQAIQHHCANILTYVDTSTFITFQAGWRISEGLSFEKEASMCKAWVSDSYRKLVALGHQVMGGTGFMEETDLQLYFRRAKAAEMAFGDADFHRELVAQQMGL